MTHPYTGKSFHKSHLYVYFLRCPFTGVVKYIGSSANPVKRAREHYGTKCCTSTEAARTWMLSLGKTKPILQVVTPLLPRDEALRIELRLQCLHHENYPGQIVNGTCFTKWQRVTNPKREAERRERAKERIRLSHLRETKVALRIEQMEDGSVWWTDSRGVRECVTTPTPTPNP